MDGGNFVLIYVQACAGGKLAFADCGPVWQLGVIAALLATSTLQLILLRMRSQGQTAQG